MISLVTSVYVNQRNLFEKVYNKNIFIFECCSLLNLSSNVLY